MQPELLHDVAHSTSFEVLDQRSERRTRWVIALTALTMVGEIGVGWYSGSVALLADGWHMGTHVCALGVTVFAYAFMRRHRHNPAFSFGTGKVGVLAGFASAIFLALVAVAMAGESVSRFRAPHPIRFEEAITVAVIGLLVNLASVLFLRPGHAHGKQPARPGHAHHHHHHDHNLRAAFLHVAADALTSLLAILALLAVRFWSLNWMDPAIGLVGALVVMVWAIGLMRSSGRVLLDSGVPPELLRRVRDALEAAPGCTVSDLHVWDLGNGHLSVLAAVSSAATHPPQYYKRLLAAVPGIVHASVEINPPDKT